MHLETSSLHRNVVSTAIYLSCLLVLGITNNLTAKELIPEDECVLELDLPKGATAEIDGKDYGTGRTIAFRSIERHKLSISELKIDFSSGRTSRHTLMLRSGQRIRLAKRDPDAGLPELMPLRITAACGLPMHRFSPDETKVLLYEGTAILYDLKTGRLLRAFPNYPDAASPGTCSQRIGAGFLPTGQQVFFGNTFWDLVHGTKTIDLKDVKLVSSSAQVSSDGDYILTGHDNFAALWEAGTGKRLRTFEHQGQVNAVSFSPDEKYALVSGPDHFPHDNPPISLWNVATGQLIRRIKAASASFSPDSEHLVVLRDATSRDVTETTYQVSLEEITSGLLSHSWKAGRPGFRHPACVNKDGSLILTCSSTGLNAEIRSTASGKLLRSFVASDQISSFDLSSDGKRAVIVSVNGEVTTWDTSTGKKLNTLQEAGTRQSYFGDVSFSPSGERLILVTENGSSVWDLGRSQLISSFPPLMPQYSNSILGPQGNFVACLTQMYLPRGNRGILVNVKSKTINELPGIPMCFSSDGHLLLIKLEQGLAIWRAGKNSQVSELRFPTDSIRTASISTDGRRVITGHDDGTCAIWNTYSGKIDIDLRGHARSVISAVFSSDGSKVLTGSEDLSAKLWDVVSGKLIRTFPGHSAGVGFATFNPSETLAIMSCEDGGKAMWNVQTGEKLRTLQDGARIEGNTVITGADPVRFIDDIHAVWASGDSGLGVWNTSKHKEICKLSGHADFLFDIRYNAETGILATCGYDDRINYYDLSTSLHVLTATLIPEGIILSTPEGLFDGSPNARNKVCYRIGKGLNVVPAERFYQDFHYPGLLEEVMRGERPMPKIEIGQQLPPEIRITTPASGIATTEESVTVDAVVDDKGGGIKKPFIKLNGSQYGVDEEPVRKGMKLHWQFTVPLVHGLENTIEVHSASADGAWESEPGRIIVRCEKPKQRPQLYMVAVGISDYADAERFDLICARNDAKAMGDLFSARGESFYGAGRVHVTTVLDDKATAEGIEKAIADVASKAKPTDVFILTLSGHGRTIGQRYYFIPYNFQSGGEQEIDAKIREQAIPHDELNDWIATVAATKRVLIYDTCQSGATITRNAFEREHALESLARKSGCHIIAAASSSENAQELPDIGHGALTYALMGGLGAADRGILKNRTAPAKDGLVSTLDWFRFAHENVPILTKLSLGVEQYATYSPGRHDFPILPVNSER